MAFHVHIRPILRLVSAPVVESCDGFSVKFHTARRKVLCVSACFCSSSTDLCEMPHSILFEYVTSARKSSPPHCCAIYLGTPCRDAFVSQSEVRHWVMSKVPECCHGALSSRAVATAWSALAEAVDEKLIMASLDFENCLDHVWPPVAIATLKPKGPSPVCRLVRHI